MASGYRTELHRIEISIIAERPVGRSCPRAFKMLMAKKQAGEALDVQEEKDVVGSISKLILTNEPFIFIDQDSGNLLRFCDLEAETGISLCIGVLCPHHGQYNF